MKRSLLLCLVLTLVYSVAVAAMVKPQAMPVVQELDGLAKYPFEVKPTVSKNSSDSVVGDVHLYSCCIPSVHPLDMDPTTGDVFVIFRSTSGYSYYLGTSDAGLNWCFIGAISPTTIRYPSAMADVVNHTSYVFTNHGIPSTVGGAVTTWDEAGYSAGLWNNETFIDILGRNQYSSYYGVIGTMGTNGVIHCLAPYWAGTVNSSTTISTPAAAFYFRSTDWGSTWNVKEPRSQNLFFYDLPGTYDSTIIFGAGNPVIHDSLFNMDGYAFIKQPHIWCSPSGDTVLLAGEGVKDSSLLDHLGSYYYRYFYKISYDAGLTWSQFTWVDADPDTLYPFGRYNAGCAFLDKNGYPHFVDGMGRDSIYVDDYSFNYGLKSGLWDLHLTAEGWKMTQISECIDTYSGGYWDLPYFCDAGIGPDGEIAVSFGSGLYSSSTYNNGNSYVDVYITGSKDNGATYSYPVKLTDGSEICAYPHISRHFRGTGTKIPVYYQVNNRGNIHWVSYDSVMNNPNPKPISPILICPSNGTKTNSTTPQFVWHRVSITDTFRIECRYGDTLGAVVFSAQIDDDTTYAPGSTLMDSVYVWRVKAYKPDMTDSSVWSYPPRFRVDTQAPLSPTATTINGTNPSPWANNTSFSVNITNPQDASGILRYYYKLGALPAANDDTTGSSLVNPFNFMATVQGSQLLYVWCQDSAGNLDYNSTDSAIVRWDSIAPGAPMGLLANGQNPSAWTSNANFSIDFTDPPDISGILRCYYKLGVQPASDNDTTGSSTAKPLNVTATVQGGQQVHVWLVDSAGNSNYLLRDSVFIRWDGQGPDLVSSYPADGAWKVEVNDSLKLVFNEPILKSTFSYTITPSLILIDSVWSPDSTTVRFIHSDFDTSQGYVLKFTCQDSLGNNLSGKDSIVFSTSEQYWPVITSVQDVASDQGGKVQILWQAVSRDVDGDTLITEYTIWQRVEAKSKGTKVRIFDGKTTYWSYLGYIPVHRFSNYFYTANTLADSMSTGTHYQYYMVSAETKNSDLFWDSAVDSGYSVDNLFPIMVQGLGGVYTSSLLLTWNRNTESDLKDYAVYRNGTSLGLTFDTSYTYSGPLNDNDYFSVTAWDVHDNQGPASDQWIYTNTAGVNDTGNTSAVPTGFAFNGAYPNPFRGATNFRYQLPKTSLVRLDIFNVSGQLVKSFTEGMKTAESHEIRWNETVTPGVYICRLVADRFVATSKIVILK